MRSALAWKKPFCRLLKYEPPRRQLTPTCAAARQVVPARQPIGSRAEGCSGHRSTGRLRDHQADTLDGMHATRQRSKGIWQPQSKPPPQQLPLGMHSSNASSPTSQPPSNGSELRSSHLLVVQRAAVQAQEVDQQHPQRALYLLRRPPLALVAVPAGCRWNGVEAGV